MSRHKDARFVLEVQLPTKDAYVSVEELTNRDGNSGTGTRYPSDTRHDGYGYRDNILPAGGTRTRPESRQVQDGYFSPPVGNPTGTRYFTTAIILGCEQVKMCLFCYINYDLFWLLNFATRLSQIFVEY
jgi:hypothetical protein